MGNNDFDWNEVDGSAQDAVPFTAPVVFWMHGKADMEEAGGVKFSGGFFFTYDQAGEGTEIPKWDESWFKGSNEKIYGIAAKGAQITIIRSRRRWFKDEDNRKEFRPWNKYEKGFRGQMQSIGFINGYEQPVCFTFKGMVVTNIEEVIRYHTAKVVGLANQTAPKGVKLPSYALWMNVVPGKHSEAGQGSKTHEVTMPELWLPKALDVDFARKMYVGKEALLRSQSLYRELDSWAHEWDVMGGESGAFTTPLGAEDYAVEREVKREMQAKSVGAGASFGGNGEIISPAIDDSDDPLPF